MYDSYQEAVEDGKSVCYRCGAIYDDAADILDHSCPDPRD